MICGKDEGNNDNAVIIELKRWNRCVEAGGESHHSATSTSFISSSASACIIKISPRNPQSPFYRLHPTHTSQHRSHIHSAFPKLHSICMPPKFSRSYLLTQYRKVGASLTHYLTVAPIFLTEEAAHKLIRVMHSIAVRRQLRW